MPFLSPGNDLFSNQLFLRAYYLYEADFNPLYIYARFVEADPFVFDFHRFHGSILLCICKGNHCDWKSWG